MLPPSGAGAGLERLTGSCLGAWQGRAVLGAGGGPRGAAEAAWAAAGGWAVAAWYLPAHPYSSIETGETLPPQETFY